MRRAPCRNRNLLLLLALSSIAVPRGSALTTVVAVFVVDLFGGASVVQQSPLMFVVISAICFPTTDTSTAVICYTSSSVEGGEPAPPPGMSGVLLLRKSVDVRRMNVSPRGSCYQSYSVLPPHAVWKLH